MKLFDSLRNPLMTGTLIAMLAVVSCDSPTCACSDPTQFRLDIFSGRGQSGAAGQPLADSIVVQVTRFPDGTLAAGVPVAFLPLSAGSVSPAEVVTDSLGRAATEWTLSLEPGIDTLILAMRTILEGNAMLVTATVQ